MLRIILLFAALVIFDVLLVVGLRRLTAPKARSVALACLLTLNSVLIPLFLLEAWFTFFMDQSDGFNITMSSRNWFEKHWRPVNSLGCRGDEPAAPGDGERLLLVIGDSFAAGHGIDDYRDRFSNLLQKKLGPSLVVQNASDIGWDTTEEYAALAAHPYTPDTVVLAYYVNDIFHAANQTGFELPFGLRFPTNPVVGFLVEHSALCNYVYWRLARMGGVKDAEKSFWGRLKAAYADPAVWAEHQKELQAVAEYCRAKDIRLIVLIFPNLLDVEGSVPLTGKVASFFSGQGVAVLDMAPMLLGRDPETMIVNSVDSHANKALHKEAAGMLETIVGK